jgi:rubrerythrin
MSAPASRTLQHSALLRLTQMFLSHVTASPRGRAHILAQLANAEGGDGGELMLFEHLLAYVDDPKLRQLIQLHHEDELRHERLFIERAEAQGAELPIIPDRVKLLMRIDAKVGLFNKPVETDEDVVRVYLALLVIEERAMAQFRLLQHAFRAAGDDATARVLEEVEADEGRHLKYCHAITKRYAPDEEDRQRRLAQMREVEAQAFAENGRENMAWTLSRGILSGWRRALWQQLARLQRRRAPSAPTAYSDMLAQGLA